MTLTFPKRTWIKVTGPLKSGTEFELADALDELRTRYPDKSLAVDLSDCPHMHSAALSVLLQQHRNLVREKRRLRLYRPQKSVMELLVITKLNAVFHVTETEEEES